MHLPDILVNESSIQSLLSKEDAYIFQAALAELYSDVDQLTLSQRTLEFAQKIIPADGVAFDCFYPDGVAVMRHWGTAEGELTTEHLDIYNRYSTQNPVFVEVVLNKRPDPVVLTDHMTVEEFENTDIYKQFYCLVGAKYQMATALWVSTDFVATVIFWASEKDFSQRDRQMLSLASPHLVNAVRNAFVVDHLRSALEVKRSGIVAVDSSGEVRFISDFARAVIGKYFPDEPCSCDSLPEPILRWLSGSSGSTAASLRVSAGENDLFISRVRNESLEQTILFEERRTICPKMLKIFDLTTREAEILFWISQGKSDPDIGAICRISHHTVSKHAQNIYRKLGVETRTAAMLVALETL